MFTLFSQCIPRSSRQSDDRYHLTDENLRRQKFNLLDPWPENPILNFILVTLLHCLLAGSSLILGSLIHAEIVNKPIDLSVIGAAYAGAAVISAGARATMALFYHCIKPFALCFVYGAGTRGRVQFDKATQKVRPFYVNVIPFILSLAFGLKFSARVLRITPSHHWLVSAWSTGVGLLAALIVALTTAMVLSAFSKKARDFFQEQLSLHYENDNPLLVRVTDDKYRSVDSNYCAQVFGDAGEKNSEQKDEVSNSACRAHDSRNNSVVPSRTESLSKILEFEDSPLGGVNSRKVYDDTSHTGSDYEVITDDEINNTFVDVDFKTPVNGMV